MGKLVMPILGLSISNGLEDPFLVEINLREHVFRQFEHDNISFSVHIKNLFRSRAWLFQSRSLHVWQNL
jgi:hypothetical protein